MDKETKIQAAIAIIALIVMFVAGFFLVQTIIDIVNGKEPATEKPVDILETTIVSMSTSEEEVEECVTEEKIVYAGPTKKPLVAIEEEEKARILLEKQRLVIEEQLQDAEYIQPQPATQDLSSEVEQSLQEDWSVATDTDASEEWTPGVYLGCYITTAYHWTGNPCADGVYPELGYTVACNDPNLWHRWVYIDGVGARYVHDRGGMSSYAHLDIYLGDRDSCINWGRRDLDVWLME